MLSPIINSNWLYKNNLRNLYIGLCRLVEQTNATQKKLCFVLHNGNGIKHDLKPNWVPNLF
jgi:hypothetical protein